MSCKFQRKKFQVTTVKKSCQVNNIFNIDGGKRGVRLIAFINTYYGKGNKSPMYCDLQIKIGNKYSC